MMGLYDRAQRCDGGRQYGRDGETTRFAVRLVIDAAAAARSVAVTLGYREFDPKVRLVGVIFNRIAGLGHLQYLEQALKSFQVLSVSEAFRPISECGSNPKFAHSFLAACRAGTAPCLG